MPGWDAILVEGGTIRFEGAGVYTDQAKDLQTFVLEAPVLTVHLRWREAPVLFDELILQVAAPAPATGPSFELHDVRIELSAGDHRGWLGFHAAQADVRALPAPDAEEIRTGGERLGASTDDVGKTVSSEDEGRPDKPYFAEDRPDAHLSGSGGREVRVDGAFQARFLGPDVRMTARENSSQWSTGMRMTNGGSTRNQTWVVLDVPAGTAVFSAPHTIAADTAFVEGADRVVAVQGEGAAATSTPMGAGSGTLSPAAAGRVGFTPAAADRSGLASTPGGPLVVWARWSPALVLLAVAAGLGVAALVRRRARRLSRVEMLSLAGVAAEEGRWIDAARWVERARGRADDARVALEHGDYLLQAGDWLGAERAFKAARRRGLSAEADLRLARMGALLGDPGALAALTKALETAPLLVVEVEEDPAFDALRRSGGYAEAVETAHRRLGDAPT